MMATYQIGAANLKHSNRASGLTEKDKTSQISTLIYAMGDTADDILTSFKLTKAQKRRYSDVRQKFKVYLM